MKTIAICNNKGGVAKTVTSVNLAAIFARDHGKRILLIDADSQANSTAIMRRDDDRNGRSLASLLRIPEIQRTDFTAAVEFGETVRPSAFEGVDLLPADVSLMDLDLSKAEDNRAWTTVLQTALQDAQDWDFVLVDCPPAFNAASAAALLAADEVLIPVKLDAFALAGMANLLQQISNMHRINPRLRIAGVLPVMWYKREQISAAERALRDAALPMLPRIRRSDLVDVMTFRQTPLIDCAPKCGACRDYRVLAKRLLQPTQTGEEASA
ncbi:MAG: ParA family protein [Oscillospiraceae bacterium]|nr:ParA family protein [Oscillospiraceae bacterium]